MVVTPDTDWFLDPILEWPFIVASLRHTCAIIMLSNQHLDMPHQWGGWIISAKEKCSLTQSKTDLWTIFERNRPFGYIEKVLDLWVELMKNGGESKSVACCVLVSVYTWTLLKDAVCRFCQHPAVEVANRNQCLSHQLTTPFREVTVAYIGLRYHRLRPQRAMRFLYKGKLRSYIYSII